MHERTERRSALRALLERSAGGPGSGIKGHHTAGSPLHAIAAQAHEEAAAMHIKAVRGHATADEALKYSENAAEMSKFAGAAIPQAKASGTYRREGQMEADVALEHAHKAKASADRGGFAAGQAREDLANFHEKAALAHLHSAADHRSVGSKGK